MYCNKCGHECPDHAAFCTRCGNPLAAVKSQPVVEQVAEVKSQPVVEQVAAAKGQPVVEQVAAMKGQPVVVQVEEERIPMANTSNQQQKKKKKSPGLFILIGGVVIVGVVAAVVIPKLLNHKSKYQCYNENRIQYTNGNDDSSIFVNGYGEKLATITEDVEYSDVDLGRSVVAATDEYGELNVINRDGIKKIDSDANSVQVSDDGTGIAYISDVSDGLGTLYLYDVEKDNKKKISQDVCTTNFNISPDGDTVLFTKKDSSSSIIQMFISVNGKEYESVGKNKYPIAVANSGKHVYYLDEGRLYVKTGDNLERLANNFSGDILLNEDYSEILINDDNKAYISVDGQSRQKIFNKSISYVLLSNKVCNRYHYMNLADYYATVYVYGIPSLKNEVFETSDGYYYVDSKLESYKVCDSSIESIYRSVDGKKILYTTYNQAYLITDFTKNESTQLQLNEDAEVRRFYVNADLDDIYYVNYDDELIYINTKGKQTKIADDVDRYNVMYDMFDDTFYFLVDASDDHGMLCYTSDGSKKEMVKDADNVLLASQDGSIFYGYDDPLKVYMVVNHKGVLVIEE